MYIGIAGPIAVGKTTFAKFLGRKKGFKVYSCSDTIRLMVEKGLYSDLFPEVQKYFDKTSRDSFLELGRELRSHYGDGIITELTIRRAIADGHRKIIIDGVRGVAEYDVIKSLNGIVIYLDAPIDVLYKRYINRKKDIDRKLSFEEFLSLLDKEEKDFSVFSSKKHADVIINNSGDFERIKKIFEIFE